MKDLDRILDAYDSGDLGGRELLISAHLPRSGASVLRVLVAAFFLMAGLARGDGQGGGIADEIVGTWSGSSVCVDRQAAPACNDEQVVYEISVSPGKSNTVTNKADKVVDGKRVPMGDLEFTHDVKSGSWASEFETPRFHALWRLTVSDAKLTGTLTLLPSKAVVRKIDLRKEK